MILYVLSIYLTVFEEEITIVQRYVRPAGGSTFDEEQYNIQSLSLDYLGDQWSCFKLLNVLVITITYYYLHFSCNTLITLNSSLAHLIDIARTITILLLLYRYYLAII